MPTHEEIRKALECCAHGTVIYCRFCPYFNETSKGVMCVTQMAKDALEYVQALEMQRERGKWDENDYCTVCDRKPITDGFEISTMYNYCPYCGAKLKTEDENDKH